MCLECFAAGQTGETCGACGAPRAKANQDVWGFDDPSPAGSPRAPPPLPSPAPVLPVWIKGRIARDACSVA